jgi:hypothetical protein
MDLRLHLKMKSTAQKRKGEKNRQKFAGKNEEGQFSYR